MNTVANKLWVWAAILLVGGSQVVGAEPATNKARKDAFGDPLPPGALLRLGTRRFQHGEQITTLAFSPDGKVLALGGMDMAISLCDVASGKHLQRLQGHTHFFGRMAYAPDGKTLASVDVDNSIILWDLPTGGTKGCLDGAACVFSPDSNKLFTGGKNVGSPRPSDLRLYGVNHDPIRCWHLASGRQPKEIACTATGFPLAVSTDGKLLASVSGRELHESPEEGVGMKDAAIHLWDLTAGKEIQRAPVVHGRVLAAAFSSSGLTIVTEDADATWIWPANAPQKARKIPGRPTHGFAFSPDGSTLAACWSGTIHLWDAATGKDKGKLLGPGYVLCMAFSPDGQRLATAGHVLRIWDIVTRKEIDPRETHMGWVHTVAISRDGKTLASADDETIRLWDRATGKQVRLVQTPDRYLFGMAYSQDGKMLAGSGYQSISLLDAANGKELRRLNGFKTHHRHVLFSPDDKVLAGVGDDAVLRTWDAATGKQLWQSPSGRPEHFARLAFSPNGKIVAVSGWDGVTALWETATGKKIRELGAPIANPRAYQILAIAFSPDGRSLVTGFNHRMQLWELATGQQRLVTDHLNEFRAVAFSPDGRLMATGHRDGLVQVWDSLTGQSCHRFVGHRRFINALTFSVDGEVLVSGSGDTTILVWDMKHVPLKKLKATPLTADELAKLWTDLARGDGITAYQAMERLIGAGNTVSFLERNLRPTSPLDPKRLAQWVEDLKSEDFKTRQRATSELEKIVDLAESALTKALKKDASLEFGRRLERILAKLTNPTGEVLQGIRAVEVLEHIGSRQAGQLLQKLAQGAPAARVTREAQASLERFNRKVAVAP